MKREEMQQLWVTLSLLLVLTTMALSVNGVPQFNIKTDVKRIFLGQSVTVTMQLPGSIINEDLSLKVYCYVDEKEWGSATTLSAGQMDYYVLLPFPNAGSHDVVCVLQQPYPPKLDWYVGAPLNKVQINAISNNLTIQVDEREIVNPTNLWNDHRKIGMEFETWFGTENWNWQLGEATPILGQYDSWNVDVIKQHAIWLTMAGTDFIVIDWTNNLNGPNAWVNRSPAIQQLINQTSLLVDTYSKLSKRSGTLRFIPPQIVLLLGVGASPPGVMTAINQQIQWIADNYLAKYPKEMFVNYLGKPLLVILDLGGTHTRLQPPVNDTLFTVRWMSTQLQNSHQNLLGYWSWMDGSINPIVTYYNNAPEAVTTTVAFFDTPGWLFNATAKLDGTTFIQGMKTPIKAKTEFTLVCQWNEFAGEPEGQGFGPNHDIYYDIYNVTYGNDMEPVSMTECGYRGCGGWGYYYLNLLQATTTLLHQSNGRGSVDWSIVGVGRPAVDEIVTGNKMEVMWNVIGKPGDKIEIFIDKKLVKTIEKFVENGTTVVDLSELSLERAGSSSSSSSTSHELTFIVYGTQTPFELPYMKMEEGYHRKNMKSPIIVKRRFILQ